MKLAVQRKLQKQFDSIIEVACDSFHHICHLILQFVIEVDEQFL